MASKFTITAELNLQTKNLNQVVNNLRQQFQGANLNIKIKDLAQAQAQINKISSSAQNAQKSVGLLGSSFSQAFKRFTVVTAVTGTIVGFTRAVKNAVGDAIEFEREVVKIAQATGKTTAQLKSLTNEISSVSTSFGVSSKELILAARSLTQAGFAADKVTGALKVLAQTELAATFDSIQDTTEGAIAVLNQFGRQAQKTGSEVAFLEKSFSAINQVSKEFAVESSDLVTAIRTTGSAFESAGGSLDELLALFTSVRATTRESAESIATGFRTIFTRVQRVDTINNLKALGIQLQDAEGKFIGPIEATKRLSTALNSIDPRDFRFNLVVEELGGFRQVSKVIPLIQQFAVTQKALNVAQGSSGSLAKDAQTAQQSLAVQIAKTREEFSRFIRDLTGTESFQNTVRFLLDLANAFIKVADSIKPLVPLIAGFATFKAGTAVKGAFDQLAGPRKKNQGGKIHAFASGGLVPGQGNGDTVPAMLTPGEFVIKKSSVKSLGVENLARANKYAAGGKVQFYKRAGEVKTNDISRQYAEDVSSFSINSAARAGSFKESLQQRQEQAKRIGEKKREYGGAFLRPVGEDTEYTGYVTKAEVLKKAKIKSKSSKAKNLEQAKYPFTIKLASVNKNTKDVFQSSILDGIANVVDQTSRKVFASSISTGAVPKDISYKTLKKSNIDQTVGNIFEASIKSLSGKFTNDDKVGAGNQTFDFPDGLGDASKYFDPELSNVRTDAKATYNLQSLQSLVEKVKTDIKEEYIPTTKKEIQKVEKSQTGLRVNVGPDIALVNNLKEMAFDKYDKNRIIENGGVAGYRPVPSTTMKGIDRNGKLSTAVTALINNKLKTEKWNKLSFEDVQGQSEFLKEVLGFANGGVASGSDTVPAMLTPGEYVINKKSAQAIGYGSLNRMNKVGKYANGGLVQFLKPGGNVTPMAPGSRALQSAFPLPNSFGSKIASAGNIPSGPSNSTSSTSPTPSSKPLDEWIAKLKASSDKLLLLGAVAGSVTSQLGGLDQATADLVSSFGATFATIKGVGGNLIDFGSNIKGLKNNPKILAGLSAGLTGFATAQAVAAARVTYLGKTAEESGKKFNSFVEALSKGEGTTQGQLTDALTKQFQAASDAQARSSGAAKIAGGVGALAAGGIATALGAGAFAPIIAAVAGPLTEEILYSVGAFSDSTNKAKVQAEALSAAMFSATTSSRDFQKFFQNIEKQTPQDVTKQAQSLAQAYKEQQTQIAKLGDLANASDTVKQQFQAVSEAAKQTAANLQTIIGVQFQGAVKRSAELLNKGFVPDVDKLLQPVFATIRSDIEAKYTDQINAAGGPGTRQGESLIKTRENEIAKAQTEQRKNLQEVAKQQTEMNAVLNIENNVRKQLIGTLQKQSAISASIERLSYELDIASKSVSNIDAAFSGSITGLRSQFDTDILKLKSPDQGALNKALDPVRAIGPIGKDLADNILNINEVMPNLEAKLIQFSTATETASGALFDVKKFVEESFNIKADSLVGKTLVNIIEGTVTGTGGEKAVTAAKTSLNVEDVRKKIVESFQKFGEEFRTQAGGILENLARAEQEGRAIAEKINESRQKQLELQLQSVDTFSNYIDALAKARGRDLSLLEKNTIRNMKQYALAGNMANNVGAIASELSSNYKTLKEGNLSLEQQTDLSFATTKLKTALEDLANQSGKTSDILAEIEKQRAKRESARDFGKEFTFGSNEQRQSIANSIQGLQRVLNTGNINDVPEELRSGVSSLLDRFKDVPVFNGRTGRQVENKLIANQFRAMGGGQFANMIEADTSTPEQILIGELQRVFAIQIHAQQALSQLEQQKQDVLKTALGEYTNAISGYTAKLEALVQEFQRKSEEKAIPVTRDPLLDFGITDNGMMNEQGQLIFPQAVPQDAKAKIDFENIQQTNDAIDAFKEDIKKSTGEINNFTLSISAMKFAMEQNSEAFKEEREKIKKATEPIVDKFLKPLEPDAQREQNVKRLKEAGFSEERINKILQKSSGGLIYRAGGGSIFQPKGTDTVPAMLTPGEFVIKKSSVDKIGVDNLSALNNGYANGGLVSYLAGGGSGAAGTNTLNDLVKRVAKLEEQVKKLEKENKILKGSLGQIAPMNQIAGGMQNMQQMMGNMTAPAPAMMFGMNRPMMGMNSRNQAVKRAKQRKQTEIDDIFAQEGFEPAVAPTVTKPKKRQDFPTSTMASDAPLDLFGLNNTELSPATVTPVELKTKAQTKEDERNALAQRLIQEARDADKKRNEERSAAINPVGPPVPKGMRPANSIYSEAQWNEMQKKADEQKALTASRLAERRANLAGSMQTHTKDGYRSSTAEEVQAHYLKKYGPRPAYISEEKWLDQIDQAENQQMEAFTEDIKKKGAKSGLSDYGSAAGSVYTEKTQEALDKAKAINQQADELTARRSGKAVGTNYASLADVPVLTAEQVGAPVTMKNIADMQAQAKAPAITGSNLTPAEQVANNVAANQPNQYEGQNALSDYLNAQGQMFGNQAIANRVADSQIWQGTARAGSFNRESKAMIENTPPINTTLPNLDYMSSNSLDIGMSPLDILNKKKLPGFARGGSTDTIPAMLTPGEFVMNKDSVSKYGKSFMEKMNKGGVVPGFANGGYVGYYAEGGNATIRNRRARGMYDGQMATTAQAMQRSVGMRQNMMANQFANNPAVQQGVMANPMANNTNQQRPATGGGAGGMSDVAQQFSQFVTQFSDAAKMMTGMTMTHKVTVDGQLNIGGINGEAIANQIRDAIGEYVGKLVEDKMTKKMEGPQ